MDSIVLVAKTLFTGVWNLLLNTNFPGTEISLAALSITLIIIGFTVGIFKFLTGFHMGDATYGRSANAVDKVKNAYKRSQDHKSGF